MQRSRFVVRGIVVSLAAVLGAVLLPAQAAGPAGAPGVPSSRTAAAAWLPRPPVVLSAAEDRAPWVLPVAQDEPAPAPPVELRAPDPPARQPERRASEPEVRGRQALDSLNYPWQELGYAIRFRPYSGGHLGLADPHTATLTIYVKPQQSPQSLRVTIAHELGHALDHRTGDAAQRERYRRLRGIPAGTPWYPCSRCSDYASPAGDYAEVFAYWLAGAGDFRSELAGPPSDVQLRELAPLFAPPSQRAAAPPPPAPRAAEPDPDDASPGLLGTLVGRPK